MILQEQQYNCIYGRLIVNSETKRKLKIFCRKHEIPIKPGMEFHCTVVYDERPFVFQHFADCLKSSNSKNPIVCTQNFPAAKVIGVDYFGSSKECLVLKIDSTAAHKLFRIWNKPNGFQYSYNPYIPHITLQYKGQNIVLQNKAISELKELPIVFDRFILEQEGKAPAGVLSENLDLSKIFDIKSCFIKMKQI